MKRAVGLTVTALMFLASLGSVVFAGDNSLSLFQYATPLEISAVYSPQLAELPLTEEMYSNLRSDFADLRIVQNSDNGVVPVRILKSRGGAEDEVEVAARDVISLEQIPADLKNRFPENHILLFQTGRFPLSSIQLSSEYKGFHSDYLLLGRSSIHVAGSEWRLLARGNLSNADEGGSLKTMHISFEESNFPQYAIVLNPGISGGQCVVDMAWGPDYHAYFEIAPDENYTLLNGYPDASPVSSFNTEGVDRLLEKGERPVQVHADSLLQNKAWRGETLRGLAMRRMFLLPLVVVAALVLISVVFVIVFAIINRKGPIKSRPRPRFYK